MISTLNALDTSFCLESNPRIRRTYCASPTTTVTTVYNYFPCPFLAIVLGCLVKKKKKTWSCEGILSRHCLCLRLKVCMLRRLFTRFLFHPMSCVLVSFDGPFSAGLASSIDRPVGWSLSAMSRPSQWKPFTLSRRWKDSIQRWQKTRRQKEKFCRYSSKATWQWEGRGGITCFVLGCKTFL